ncbi:MAG: hypothetical protein U1F66_10365 [bacterium]
MDTSKVSGARGASGTQEASKAKNKEAAQVGKGYITASSAEGLAGLQKMGPNAVTAFSVGGEVRFVSAGDAANKYEKHLKSTGTPYAKLTPDQFKAITWGGKKASVGANVQESRGGRGKPTAQGASPQGVAGARGPGKAKASEAPKEAEKPSGPPSGRVSGEHRVRTPLKNIAPSGERLAKH